jgi:hypothetical protein
MVLVVTGSLLVKETCPRIRESIEETKSLGMILLQWQPSGLPHDVPIKSVSSRHPKRRFGTQASRNVRVI